MPNDQEAQEALTQSEATKFITENVNRLLISYVKQGAIAFGVVNVLALIGLFYSVHKTAMVAAQSEAVQYVDQHMKSSIEETQKLISTANDNLSALYRDYGMLLERKAILEHSIGGLSTSLDVLKNSDSTKY